MIYSLCVSCALLWRPTLRQLITHTIMLRPQHVCASVGVCGHDFGGSV